MENVQSTIATPADLDRRLDDTTASAGLPPRLTGHLPALDGLRGLAIVLVLLCHFLPYSDQPHSAMGRLFFFVGRCGWCGVDLFFVLSGFLITGILFDAKNSAHYFRNFYARRTLRIFPLYYGVLAVIFIVIPLVHPAAFAGKAEQAVRHDQAWLWTYCGNLRMAMQQDMYAFGGGWINLNPFWSLSVEEHFYLIWPAVVFFCSRRTLLWISVACMVVGLVVKIDLSLLPGDHFASIYVLTPSRMDALACGALLALLMRGPRAQARMVLWWARPVAVVCGILALLTISRGDANGPIISSLNYTLLALGFGGLLLWAITAPASSAVARTFTFRGLRTLGKYSYGLYVYHVTLLPLMDRLFGQRKMQRWLESHLHLGHAAYGLSVVLFILMAATASFAAAFASWHLYERHFLKLKRYFEYRRKPAPARGAEEPDAIAAPLQVAAAPK